jgi:hypothetical protein
MASVKRKPVLIAVAVAVVVVGGGGYWAASVLLKPSASTDYLNEIAIGGYQQISATDGGHGSSNAPSTGVYLGPAVSDDALLKAIEGPDLVLKSTDLAAYGITPQPGSQFNQVALEYSAANACGVEVGTLQPGTAPDAGWNLTAQQIKQVQSGASMIFDLEVTCGVTIGVGGVGVS